MPTIKLTQFLKTSLAWPNEPVSGRITWRLAPPVTEEIRFIHFRKILDKNPLSVSVGKKLHIGCQCEMISPLS